MTLATSRSASPSRRLSTLRFESRGSLPVTVAPLLGGMAHHDDRTHRRPRQVRLLGAQRQWRPGDQRHRTAHRLGLRVQQEAGADGREQRLRVRAVAGPLRGQLRRRVPARVDELLAGPAAGHRAAEGHRRRPPRPVATRRAREAGRHRRPSVQRPVRRQRGVGLVQGRVHPSGRAVARARRALPAQRRVPAGVAQDLDRGRRRFPRRLLPDPRLHAQAQAAQHAGAPEPRTVPGRQLDGSPAQRRPVLRLVLLQRQGLRRRHRAGRRGARPCARAPTAR